MPGPADEQTLSARWVFPVSGPPLPGGTVTVRGDRIESVDPAGARTPDVDFGNAAIIPGLVNAHTHLDLTGAAGSSRRPGLCWLAAPGHRPPADPERRRHRRRHPGRP